MSIISEIVVDKIPEILTKCPDYWSSFLRTCEIVDPPYGLEWYGNLFRESAYDLNWVCRLLVVNAQKESDGARQLWTLSGRIENPLHSEKVRQHAIDESRHASFYIAMLELAFPDAVSMQELVELRNISPGFKFSDHPPRFKPLDKIEILDELIQMNIGEVRTLINQMLLRPVLDVVAPDASRRKLLNLIDSLGDDEASHIFYTAELIEELYGLADIDELMRLRTLEFSQITCREVGASDNYLSVYS